MTRRGRSRRDLGPQEPGFLGRGPSRRLSATALMRLEAAGAIAGGAAGGKAQNRDRRVGRVMAQPMEHIKNNVQPEARPAEHVRDVFRRGRRRPCRKPPSERITLAALTAKDRPRRRAMAERRRHHPFRTRRRRACPADARRPLRRAQGRDRGGGATSCSERGWTPYDVLTKALVAGMTIVGVDFRDGILFVPEVLLAANAMKAGMAILKPLLVETGAPQARQDGDRHGQGRHPRHRQEPGRR